MTSLLPSIIAAASISSAASQRPQLLAVEVERESVVDHIHYTDPHLPHVEGNPNIRLRSFSFSAR